MARSQVKSVLAESQRDFEHDSRNTSRNINQTSSQHDETAEQTPWQFYIVLGMIGIGVLGLILKTIGLF